MKKTQQLESGNYYLFESKSSSRSCYFESRNEAELFKKLLYRYLHKYVEVHHIYLCSEGYHILLRIRGEGVLKKWYISSCNKKGRIIRSVFLSETWRIVSEQVRIFHSVYAKAINKIRNRKGVLVQERYVRYFFESVEEFKKYIDTMKKGKEIRGQRNAAYGVSLRWKKLVNWGIIRSKKWVESAMDVAFRNYVVEKLIISTLLTHSQAP